MALYNVYHDGCRNTIIIDIMQINKFVFCRIQSHASFLALF